MEHVEIEDKLKRNPATHRLVLELVDRAKELDCVDFYYDLKTVLIFAKARMEYYLGGGT